MTTQTIRAEAFAALHRRPSIFAIPNPWDAGSAKVLTALGFEALATTSAGLAFALGRPDGEGALTRDETLANARAIVDATPLPSAPISRTDSPTTRKRAETTARGRRAASVARSRTRPAARQRPSIHSTRRSSASSGGRSSARSSVPVHADGAPEFLHGIVDLQDTIRRSSVATPAPMLFAPGLTSLADTPVVRGRAEARQRDHGARGQTMSLSALEDVGVRRVSGGPRARCVRRPARRRRSGARARPASPITRCPTLN
jgi:hypothetical protein